MAVNIAEEQNDKVLPFLSENRYTFTPYKMNAEIKQAYGVHGAPEEFLIDRNGRTVGMVRLNSEEKERLFGELVEKLWKE